MKSKPNTHKCFTFWVFYYWLKIIGINSLSLSKKNQLKFSYSSLIYGCFLATSYFYMIYRVFVERSVILWPGETPLSIIVDFSAIILNLLEFFSTWLIFLLCQNRIKSIVQGFMRAEEMSTRLEIPDDYGKHFRKLGIKLTAVTTLYLAWGGINNLLAIQNNDSNIFIWSWYFASRIVSYNVGTLFVWTLIILKHKFRRLNHKLQFLLRNSRTNAIGQCNFTILSNTVNIITQLHRELRDLINRVQGHYAPLIFLNILMQFYSITLNVHIMYRFAKEEGLVKGTNILYFISIGVWVVIPLILLVIISNVSDSTAKEANATGSILHIMIGECEDFDCTRKAAELKVMSLDLLHNRVKLSILGFFDLDSSLVYNTVATSTTYLMIMLQFYG